MNRTLFTSYGFTLIEILIVIGLLGLLSTLIISSTNVFLSQHKKSAEDVFWSAVDTASQTAIETDKTVQLAVRENGTVLVLARGGETVRFLIPDGSVIDFIRKDSRSTSLIGGQLVDTDQLSSVNFYRDGTCDPFRAQVRIGEAKPRRLMLDHWTCALVLADSGAE